MTTPNTDAARPDRPWRHTLGDGRRLSGFADDGYGAVVDQFVANFTDRRDLGSACAVFVDGRIVVDLWGGIADARSGREWTNDTTAVTFSCTKGILAICMHLLAQDGRLVLDAPVTAYWPEFGRSGKEHITVREVMSHRSGLPALDTDLTRADVIAWAPVIEAIERQAPLYASHHGFAYHHLTYGWLVGEVIRRITGQLPGRFLAPMAKRLSLRTWIGLPPEAAPDVAWMEPPLPDEDSDGARLAASLLESDPLLRRGLTMGGAFEFPVDGAHVTFNDRDLQAAQIPGANGISDARSLARLYAACVSDIGGPRLLTPESVAAALVVQSAGRQATGMPDDGGRWGTGFQLHSPPSQPMLGTASFGHAGAGGQLAFADERFHLGFAYLSNQMGGYGDVRARSLTAALRRLVTR